MTTEALTQAIELVRESETHDLLFERYFAIRRQARDADRSIELCDAHDEASSRLGEVEVAPLITFG